MIAVSALAVQTFNTDIVFELMKAYGGASQDTDKTDANGQRLSSKVDGDYVFAQGAIIDLVVTL